MTTQHTLSVRQNPKGQKNYYKYPHFSEFKKEEEEILGN